LSDSLEAEWLDEGLGTKGEITWQKRRF